jgi:hypothetical protein
MEVQQKETYGFQLYSNEDQDYANTAPWSAVPPIGYQPPALPPARQSAPPPVASASPPVAAAPPAAAPVAAAPKKTALQLKLEKRKKALSGK